MNREIKFRVWDGKEMQYPEYFIFNRSWDYSTNWSAFQDIKNKYGALWELTPENRIKESNQDALMQYTGLKDKNGKEIYEGDILGDPKYPLHRKIVEWKSQEGDYESDWYTGFAIGVDSGDSLDDYEVIGNIHENQELLEENKND